MNFRGISAPGNVNRLANNEGGALDGGAEGVGDGERQQVMLWDISIPEQLKDTISRDDSLAI